MTEERRYWMAALIFVLVMLLCACASSGRATVTGASASSTITLPPAGTSVADLRATARAWAQTFLVGSVEDIQALQGPECAPSSATTIATSTAVQYLRAMRDTMQTHLGRSLDKITIRGVIVRNVSSTRGDALVEYDLPAGVVGNDNWVSYAVHAGRWKVADCHAPIGGNSVSKRSTPSR